MKLHEFSRMFDNKSLFVQVVFHSSSPTSRLTTTANVTNSPTNATKLYATNGGAATTTAATATSPISSNYHSTTATTILSHSNNLYTASGAPAYDSTTC